VTHYESDASFKHSQEVAARLLRHDLGMSRHWRNSAYDYRRAVCRDGIVQARYTTRCAKLVKCPRCRNWLRGNHRI